ncbi:GNAT family N-acetyltransferase [Acidisphaera sp. L21]|jgi:RimJ/RimL family protein N-acetyltransferase|uniref:GNAT family N-acetyltransferase n=1 Tax=Acidisphaera sp. L21 TaxID=1641851 RepID=UPI0020B13CD1|nr:GNAT family N-acetyltransferase [Acidisphaera sp. L21]
MVLTPYQHQDLSELAVFKADPRVWAMMLGGVRTPQQTADELAGELAFWASHDIGMWTARDLEGRLLGVTGLHARPDARGIALRFAFDPIVQGRGLAREAAAAVLRDGHERAGLTRIVAIARETNIGSRTVLGGIGMREVTTFQQAGHTMLMFESERPTR